MEIKVLDTLLRQCSNLASGGAGAFGGAWLAFLLQRRYAEKQERRQQAARIMRAHFDLSQKDEQLHTVTSKIEKIKDHPERFLMQRPIFVGPPIHLDLASLGFISESRRPEALVELFRAEKGYEIFMELLEERNRLCRELSARLSHLERNGLDVGARPDETEKKIGHDLMGELRRATDRLSEVTNEVLDASQSANKLLVEYQALELPKEISSRYLRR